MPSGETPEKKKKGKKKKRLSEIGRANGLSRWSARRNEDERP